MSNRAQSDLSEREDTTWAGVVELDDNSRSACLGQEPVIINIISAVSLPTVGRLGGLEAWRLGGLEAWMLGGLVAQPAGRLRAILSSELS